MMLNNAGTVLRNLPRSDRSSFAGQRVRGLHSDVHSIFGEFDRSGAEKVVRDFEKNNSSNSSALSKYVKALVGLELQTKGSRHFPFTRFFLTDFFFSHA